MCLSAASIALQACITAFLFLHDWIPLGRLNNLTALSGQDSLARRLITTIISGAPSAVGLVFSLRHWNTAYPGWLNLLLWINYGVLLLGLLRAWWIPYLIQPDPERAVRYQVIFADTHTFLPCRNGMAPNTLHVIFHLSDVALLAVLFFRTRMPGC
jgi:hypothetical protein